MTDWKNATVDGDDYVGDDLVPVLVPRPGKSVQDVARANGLRVLGRREETTAPVVALIDMGIGLGLKARAVREEER